LKSTYQAPVLATLAIEAHGGLEHWKRFSTVSVHGINGGVLWGAKGNAGVLDDVTVTIALRDEKVSHWPFGSQDRRSRFEPQRVALENANGEVVEQLLHPDRRSGGTLSRPLGAICNSHTSSDARGLAEDTRQPLKGQLSI
jgi:hypothetical protein